MKFSFGLQLLFDSFVPSLPSTTDARWRALRQSDVHMWAALEAVQMKDYVQSLPGGLDAPVAEGGGNLSVSVTLHVNGRLQPICHLFGNVTTVRLTMASSDLSFLHSLLAKFGQRRVSRCISRR